MLGWAVHGEKINNNQSYFTQTTNEDCELLYRLDVLGVEDRREFDQEEIMKEFVESIQHQHNGRYKVRVPWIEERVPQSRARLKNLLSKMKGDVRERYDAIVKEQLELGIIEEAPSNSEGRLLFYMPHRPVIREGAVSTKIKMVFDASAKPSPEEYSIYECMNPGAPTQPFLGDILIRSRLAPVCIVGDIEKVFLQVELDKSDRNTFRFIYKPRNSTEKHYRLCRVPFGGESSPFMLWGVVKNHLETSEGAETVKELLKENTYVSNVMGLVSTEEETKNFKSKATEIMSKRKFPLGKWESNIEALNDDKERAETKLLGVGWNKKDDSFAVGIEINETATITKRIMLKTLASIYDLLGLMSPILAKRKHLYRLAVDERRGRDNEVSTELKKKWV